MEEMTGFEAHVGDTPVAASVADQARSAAGGGDAGAFESLKAAVQEASPDERGAAAKQLADEKPAYETLHRALQELGIEPAPGEPNNEGE